MASQDVTLSIGVDSSAVKPGLDQVKGDFQAWAGSTNAVASATQKLEQQLKGFAQEQRVQGRMARFYANELTEMIPAADGAKRAIQGLMGLGIEGLAGGIGFGFALESVKLLAMGLEQVGATARKTFAEADKVVSKVLDEWKKKAEAMQRALAVAMGGEGAGIRLDLAASLKTINAEIDKARGSLDSLMFPWQRAELQKSLDAMIAKRAEIIRQAASTYATEKLVTAERSKQVEVTKAVVDQENLEIARLDAINKKLLERAKIVDAEMPAGIGITEGEARSAWNNAGPVFGPGNDEGAAAFATNLEKVNAESAQMQMLWTSIGSSVSSAFSGIGQAVGGMAGKVLAWLGQMITQAISLAIAMSAAGSAWATPLGSLAIAGTVAAGLIALLNTVSARADGGPVEAFRPYLVGERGPELIIPGQSGTVIPNHQLGGAPTNIYITAFDGHDVERVLSKHESAVFRVLERGRRYRRGA